MTDVRWLVVGIVAGGAWLLSSACSSVPDIQFVDGDASASSSSGSSSGSDGGSDASDGGSSGTPDWSCPTNPPPSGDGVCCGNKLCLRCTSSDCSACAGSGCGGGISNACCKNRGNGSIQCKASDQCL